MNKNMKPVYFFVVSFFLLLSFASMVAVAKNDNSKNSETKGEKVTEEKNNKNEEIQKNNIKDVSSLTEYKKVDAKKGETNAQLHKDKTTEVIENLEQVSIEGDTTGTEVVIEAKNKAKKQIEEVATEQVASQLEVVEAIEGVEDDGAVKKFFFGPDYKNLGQLRSELVQNRNQIRKLTQAMETLNQNGGDTLELKNQLTLLTQERSRISDIISNNQETFSLLGWFSRFLNNYEQTPVDGSEEDELLEEVKEVIEDIQTVDDNSVEVEEDEIDVEVTPATDTSTENNTTEAVLVQ